MLAARIVTALIFGIVITGGALVRPVPTWPLRPRAVVAGRRVGMGRRSPSCRPRGASAIRAVLAAAMALALVARRTRLAFLRRPSPSRGGCSLSCSSCAIRAPSAPRSSRWRASWCCCRRGRCSSACIARARSAPSSRSRCSSIVWAADVGAYAVGRMIGRTKLAPGSEPRQDLGGRERRSRDGGARGGARGSLARPAASRASWSSVWRPRWSPCSAT